MPTPATAALTRGELHAELVRRAANLLTYQAEGTATAGTTTTISDSLGLSPFGTNDVKLTGKWIYVYKGTQAGSYSNLASNTSSAYTFAPAMSGAPDSTSQYIVYSANLLTPLAVDRAIRSAAQQLTWDRLTKRGCLLEAVGREIILGNALANGSFDLYTTANQPNSWTRDGTSTFTQENTITLGRRAIKVVTDGTNTGFLRQAISGWGRFVGYSVQLNAWVRSDTASSRVTIQLADGVTTQTVTHTGGSKWLFLQTSPFTVSTAATQLQASIEITSGAAVTVYCGYMFLQDVPSSDTWASYGFNSPFGYNGARQRFDIDTNLNLIAIEPELAVSGLIDGSNFGGDNFVAKIDGHNWEIDYTATRQLHLRDMSSLWDGRILQYRAWKANAELTAVGTTWTASEPDAVIELAHSILVTIAAGQPAVGNLGNKRNEVLAKYGTRLPAGSKLVEPSV